MIVGHNTIKKFFANAIKSDNLAHAYLFYGSEGLGKKGFAEELAKSLNKVKGFDADFRILEGTDSIGIGVIRDIKRFFSFKSYFSPWKITIIDDAHRMTTEAQNALLKVLEEPSSNSLIILVSHDLNSILSVIKSRCQLVNFKPISSQIIRNEIMAKGIPTSDADIVISIANGRLGYALKLLEKDNLKKIKKALDAFEKLQNAPIASKFGYAKKLAAEDDPGEYLYYWVKYLRGSLFKNKDILQKALKLNSLIRQSKFNKKLALENFLIHV